MSRLTNKLSHNLLKFQQNKSSVVSSYSALSCFNLLWQGLSGDSLNEVNKSFGIDNKDAPKYYSELYNLHKTLQKESSLKVCNFVLTKNTLQLQQPYVSSIAQLGNHEYFSDDEINHLVPKVNILVKHNTNGLIDDLLSPEDIKDDTIFVLLNTIYFKSDWNSKFDANDTNGGKFVGLLGDRKEMFMHLTDGRLKYHDGKTFQMLEMPYKNSNFTFGVILQKDKKATPLLMDELTLEQHIKLLQYEFVNVTFPKFTQETELDMIPFFKQIGINKIFDDMDPYNMIQYSASAGKYFISVIKQKVKLIVDENGTEASAATVIVGCEESCMETPETIEFVADHPFSYYIRYVPTNTLLFSGMFV